LVAGSASTFQKGQINVIPETFRASDQSDFSRCSGSFLFDVFPLKAERRDCRERNWASILIEYAANLRPYASDSARKVNPFHASSAILQGAR
jgi:hypothetical protein